jgi:hypothetical protein
MCFALILKGSHKPMYLMASHQETRDKWLRGLRYAIQMDHLAEQRNEVDKYPYSYTPIQTDWGLASSE